MIGNISTYRIKTISEKPSIPGYETCQVMSWHKKDTPYYELSPYYLRTDGLEENINSGGVIFENLYQGSKIYPVVYDIEVYPHHTRRGDSRYLHWKWQKENHIDSNGNIIWATYMNWRYSLFRCNNPIHYPNGRNRAKEAVGTVFLSKNQDGTSKVEILNYIEARHRVYRKEYCRLIRNLNFYQLLFQKVMSGINISLQEIDVPHPSKRGLHGSLCHPSGVFVTSIENIDLLINDSSEPFGHGLCVAYALHQDIASYVSRISNSNLLKNNKGTMTDDEVLHEQDNMFSYIKSILNSQKIKKLIGIKYDGPNMDFESMINGPSFTDSIFIFNDNYLEHKTDNHGGGNAKIRPYNNYSKRDIPRSFGIPTGNYCEGYTSLNESINQINECITEFIQLLHRFQYQNIVYSIENIGNPTIGTGIFKVDKKVLRYITKCLLMISYGGEYTNYSSTFTTSASVRIDDDVVKFMDQ
uniref:Uncharacterized protein n=1 Tax=viral metagenome TaxID=1070528 RepID=A0A6C0BD31_9ZZZZ